MVETRALTAPPLSVVVMKLVVVVVVVVWTEGAVSSSHEKASLELPSASLQPSSQCRLPSVNINRYVEFQTDFNEKLISLIALVILNKVSARIKQIPAGHGR